MPDLDKLRAMAADTTSPFEAEAAQRLLDKLTKKIDQKIPIPPKRPRKKTLLIVLRIADANNVLVVKKDTGFYWRGLRSDVEAAHSSLEDANS